MYSQMVEEVITKQLNRLDRNFFSCLNYDNLPELTTEFVKFAQIPNLEQSFKNIYRQVNKLKQERLIEEHKDE